MDVVMWKMHLIDFDSWKTESVLLLVACNVQRVSVLQQVTIKFVQRKYEKFENYWCSKEGSYIMQSYTPTGERNHNRINDIVSIWIERYGRLISTINTLFCCFHFFRWLYSLLLFLSVSLYLSVSLSLLLVFIRWVWFGPWLIWWRNCLTCRRSLHTSDSIARAHTQSFGVSADLMDTISILEDMRRPMSVSVAMAYGRYSAWICVSTLQPTSSTDGIRAIYAWGEQ